MRATASNFLAFVAALLAGSLCFTDVAQSNSTGAVPGNTNVPAGGGSGAEQNCTACHQSYRVNPDKAARLVLFGMPAAYTPGQRYRITLKFIHPTAKRWGFQLTAVNSKDFGAAGDFAAVGGDKSVRRVSGGPGKRNYIGHGPAGRAATGIGSAGSHSWTFEWIAPPRPQGQVVFFASANAANGDGSQLGDKIYVATARSAGR